MGSSESKVLSPYMEDWLDLTFLKKPEIVNCYIRFREIDEASVDANPIGCRIPNEAVIEHFPELTSNPFAHQLCKVFATSNVGMSFEDFLDMVSVLSEEAPAELKADWAFRVFDFNGDQKIDEADLRNLIQKLTGTQSDDMDHLIQDITKRVLREADVRESIGLEDFRSLVSKSADFKHNFTIRM